MARKRPLLEGLWLFHPRCCIGYSIHFRRHRCPRSGASTHAAYRPDCGLDLAYRCLGEATGLAVRNLFRTKRIPWETIDKLEVSETIWSPGNGWSGWAYATVRHHGRKTHIKALIAVYDFRPDSMVAELRELADRSGLLVDESSVAEFVPSASARPESEQPR